MIRTNTDPPSDQSPKKPNLLHRIHRFTCIICTLLVVYYMFLCIASVADAVQSVHKFDGLCSQPLLLDCLSESLFPNYVCLFLWTCTELLLYIVLCRKANQKQAIRGSMLYFSVMLIVHIAVLIHANLLIPPENPYSTTDIAVMFYRVYVPETILPPIAYFLLYLWRVRAFKAIPHVN